MADYSELVLANKSDIVAIADEVREKAGTTEQMSIGGILQGLKNLSAGGIDTSDATATADDMAEGVTAYVKGQKVVGSLRDDGAFSKTSSTLTNGSNEIYVKVVCDEDAIVREGDTFNLPISKDNFGDATPEDVVAGKTFTSAAGGKVVGTHECGGGIPSTIIAGDTPVMGNFTGGQASGTTLVSTGVQLTIPKAGTYRFKVSGYGSSGAFALYKNGSQVASNTLSAANKTAYSNDVSCAEGDVIEVWGRGSTYGTVYVYSLVACIDWDNGM